LEQIKTIKKILVMKKVFVKGFAFAAVVALSFANISCEQKAEESVEAAAEDAVEAADAAGDAAAEAGDAAVEATEAAAEATGEAVEAAAENVDAAATEAVEAPATEEAPAQ